MAEKDDRIVSSGVEGTPSVSEESKPTAISSAEITGTLNLFETKIKALQDQAGIVKAEFGNLERRQDRANHFMMWLTGIIAGVFFVTGTLIALDYFRNNQERYEKFIDKTENFYTKVEVDKNISASASSVEKNLVELKKCLAAGGWRACFQ